MPHFFPVVPAALMLGLALGVPVARAHGPAPATEMRPVPVALQVHAELPPPVPDVADLKFRDLFRLPVGPRGLEPTALLRSLDGRRVRMVGYMARQDRSRAAPGRLVLAPLPVTLDDEDDSLADDLPVTAVHVLLADAQRQQQLPHMQGLMALTGTLQLGARAEPDGRRSMLRLLLDDSTSRAFEAGPATGHPPMWMEKLHEPAR
jgi:hypothetical protein